MVSVYIIEACMNGDRLSDLAVVRLLGLLGVVVLAASVGVVQLALELLAVK